MMYTKLWWRVGRAVRIGLVAGTLLGCVDSEASDVPTQVIVVVDADSMVRGAAKSLRVQVEGGDDVDRLTGRTTRLDEAVKPIDFPKRVALVPLNGDENRAFVLTATALDASGSPLSQARLISGYAPGQVRYARLLIEGGPCLGKVCQSDDETCGGGACLDARVDPMTFSTDDKKPTTSVPRVDAAVGDSDATTGDDGQVDDGQVDFKPEAAITAGASCNPEGASACAVQDSTAPLLCSDGRWETASPCDEGELCVSVDGDAVCRADTNECLKDTDDCDNAPDACINSLGSYMCQCPDGYAGGGQGPDGCLDIDECGTGVADCDTDPAAVCNEVVGGPSTCTCPSGYTGTGKGKGGCLDIDECKDGPKAACGAGATGCQNTAGSYACTCSAGFSGTGGNVCVDIDECKAGTESACGTFASGCTNTSGSYRCACMEPYASDVDGRGCHPRAWGTPTPVDDGKAGDADRSAVTVDTLGNVTAVWQQSDTMRTNIWANRFTPGVGWGTAQLIETDDSGDASNPSVAADGAGNVTAVWQQSDGTRSNVWTNRFVAGSWGTATLIENGVGDADSPAIAADEAGNVTAVWRQFDGTRFNVWANRFSGGRWGTAAMLETVDAGDAAYPALSTDAGGHVTAVWMQSDGAVYSIWANRWTGSQWGAATLLETNDAGDAGYPKVATDGDGAITVVWHQSDGTRYSIWGNHFTSGAWSGPTLLETDDTADAFYPAVAADGTGNVTAVWQQRDGTGRYNVLSNRFVGGRWGTVTSIEPDNQGDGYSASLAVDAVGNVTAVWAQYDGTRGNVWTNRYVVGGGWGNPMLVETANAGQALRPSVTVAASGNVTAVWPQDTGTRFSIFANRFD